ncbi:uncharacterized protein LOC111343613 [Stylophora pistillata]|uniref:uncharacterized protein LOC111343613 n=1 Tax=Stylophora pistillata TaxID=50429 RepID=UPI000C04DA9E|nr:uncharacterized protein LOC111343613 [Stylophora pistillata]
MEGRPAWSKDALWDEREDNPLLMPALPNFELNFFHGPLAKSSRFANLSDQELNQLVEQRHSEKTKKVTNWSVSTFRAWCSEKTLQTPLEDMTIGQLDHNLRRFNAEARTQKGEPYSKSTLLGFRHGTERYLNSPAYNKGPQLASDPRFVRSNQVLGAQLVNLKRSGKENITHKPAIEEEHLKQLKASVVFSLSYPLSLLKNIWFHIVLFFCRRGSEGQRGLTTKRFNFGVNAAGRKFATMAHDEGSQNHPAVSMTNPITKRRLEFTKLQTNTTAIRLQSTTLKI